MVDMDVPPTNKVLCKRAIVKHTVISQVLITEVRSINHGVLRRQRLPRNFRLYCYQNLLAWSNLHF